MTSCAWTWRNVLCGHEDLVTTNLGVDNLRDDVLVGEANHQAVLGCIVLVLRLGDQPLTRIVVGWTLLTELCTGCKWCGGTYFYPDGGACT